VHPRLSAPCKISQFFLASIKRGQSIWRGGIFSALTRFVFITRFENYRQPRNAADASFSSSFAARQSIPACVSFNRELLDEETRIAKV